MGDTVFVNGRSAIHKGSRGKSTAFPDVNLCPPSPPAGPVPTPLPNIAQAADLQGGASSVLIEGSPMAKKSSYFGKSTGNAVARSTGGGLMSHAVEGGAYFGSYSMDVMVEGEPAPRHLDMMTHNHTAPSPPNAGVGTYVGVMDPGAPAKPAQAGKTDQKGRKAQEVVYRLWFELCDGSGKPTDDYELLSADGRYKKRLSGAQATRKETGLLALEFTGLLPGTVYSLFQILPKDTRIPVFERLSFDKLHEHKPGQAG